MCQTDGARLREAGTEQDPLIGKIIKERYRVMKKVGEGGMGTVYLAEQISVGRKVALKILHPEFARDQEFVKRFRQEARLAASLNHRNVITVFDFDQGDDGSLFIAMEYVDGRSLKEVIQEGSLSIERAVRLGIQIAEGLHAAHRAGVIHRDIKPENIMVIGEGAEEVKLMDFGIARLRDAGASTRLTRSGMILGTPVYMAPEQIEGGEVSERTDIYAFGVVLYEMLSGDVPFKAPTPSAVLMKHLQEMPVPLRKLRKEIPPSVERVVMQALEKKPDKRQRDMQGVVEGLKKAHDTLEPEQISKTLLATQPLDMEEELRTLRSKWKVPDIGSPFKKLGQGLSSAAGQVVKKAQEFKAARRERALEQTAEALKRAEQKSEEEQVPKTLLATRPLEVKRGGGVRLPKLKFISLAALVVVVGAAAISGGLYLYRHRALSKPQVLPVPQAKIVSLIIRAEKQELKTSESTALKIKAQYSDGREEEIAEGVRWQSSDPSVIAVSRKGEAEGQNAGSASITARYGDIAAPPLTLMVKAKEPELPPAPPVTRLVSLTVRADKRDLKVNERTALALEGKYSDGKVENISQGADWRSSNRATAEVDSKGEVTAQKEGKVNITARYAGIISSPLALSIKGATKSNEAERPNDRAMQAHIKVATDHRERGEYSDALAELEKARLLEPANRQVQAEIETTKKACNAEKRLGRAELTCQ